MSQYVPGQILDVVWIHFVPPSPKKGPDLDEASPADGGAGRGAEVHVFFDQIRWRATTRRSAMIRSLDINGVNCTFLKSKLTSFCSSSGRRYGMFTMIAKRSTA